MNICSLTLLHLELPFKGHFVHAKKDRSSGDTLLIRVKTSQGNEGWGEVLARSYVTGETHEDILRNSAPRFATQVIGLHVQDQGALERWVDSTLTAMDGHLALFGGIELALWNAMSAEQGVDLDRLLGPGRTSATGHCVTIGFDASDEALRTRAIHARLKGATTVKLKVGLNPDDDARRLRLLNKHFAGRMPLRIDGNGTFELDSAVALLNECKNLPLESFEEPISRHSDNLEQRLVELHNSTGVDLLADESLCSLDDAQRWIRCGGYQRFNIRVGKHGGLIGSRRIRDLADRSNVPLVGGSMVGESGVLTQASRVFLSRSNSISYIEGLGQNRSWLAMDPMHASEPESDDLTPLTFREEACQPLLRAKRYFD